MENNNKTTPSQTTGNKTKKNHYFWIGANDTLNGYVRVVLTKAEIDEYNKISDDEDRSWYLEQRMLPTRDKDFEVGDDGFWIEAPDFLAKSDGISIGEAIEAGFPNIDTPLDEEETQEEGNSKRRACS